MTMPTPQQPGWYPDPWGEGAQRYFDGTNWGPPAQETPPLPPIPPPPNQKPPGKRSGKKVLWAVAGVVAFLALVSTCGNDDKKSDSIASRTSSTSATATTTSSTTSQQATSSATPTTPAGPTKPDANFTTSEGANGQDVTATFTIGDNLTEGFIKTGARLDTIEILKYAAVTFPNAAQVTVVGSFPMEDAYGNTSVDEVVNVTYLRSTLDKINFDGVDSDKIWELRDSGFIAPAFQP